MTNRKIIIAGFLFFISFILINWISPELLNNKMISYVIMGLGFALWYYAFNNQISAGIFSGSFIFFIGIILFIISSFVIWNPDRIIFPALLISIGMSSFFTYLNDKKFFYLVFSIAFVLLGFNFLYARMSFKFLVFLNAIPNLILGIGIFILIILIILSYLFRRKRIDKDGETNNQIVEDDDIKN